MDYNSLLQSAAGPQWQRFGAHHHHGICLPLFSLHSEKSGGIGEFYDLIPLIDWCQSIGIDIIQLLPLNDTGLDTSPYNAISAFAINPIYLSLHELPGMNALSEYSEKMSKIRYWSQSHRVKHHIVRELKLALLREYFFQFYPQLSTSEPYQTFVNQNLKWLEPYALFKSLKEINFWKNWEDWPASMKTPSIKIFQNLVQEYQQPSAFHIFLQYLCFVQLAAVKNYANQKNVFIKGDIPILIARDSADVWHNRHLFLMHLAAGAPPDVYSQTGQYWGFPVYDWEELTKTGYSWWKERLQLAAYLYDLYRLDHVVGFFRMWAIESGKPPQEGFFIPSNSQDWIAHGRKLMEMVLKAAPILPIAEDLGAVPPEFKECLYSLGICGTKVMRWERRWDQGGGYIPINEYQPMTMTTVSTHDTDPLQLWWRHAPKEAKLFAEFKGWFYKPFLSTEYHEKILWDSHHSNSLLHINLLQEYLALFPELVSKNPHHERINIPGKVLETNWTYRFKPSLEKIVSHFPLREKLLSLIH